MIIKAETQEAYDALCRLPVSLPLANMKVDVDPEVFKNWLAISGVDVDEFMKKFATQSEPNG
jgi:hypothetical protein